MRMKQPGTGASSGSAAATSASLRWAAGVSGLGFGPAALAKKRRPSSVPSRAATPGENPADWENAKTTGLPSRSSTAARTRPGISDHSNLNPAASGCLDAFILVSASVRVSRNSLTYKLPTYGRHGAAISVTVDRDAHRRSPATSLVSEVRPYKEA